VYIYIYGNYTGHHARSQSEEQTFGNPARFFLNNIRERRSVGRGQGNFEKTRDNNINELYSRVYIIYIDRFGRPTVVVDENILSNSYYNGVFFSFFLSKRPSSRVSFFFGGRGVYDSRIDGRPPVYEHLARTVPEVCSDVRVRRVKWTQTDGQRAGVKGSRIRDVQKDVVNIRPSRDQ